MADQITTADKLACAKRELEAVPSWMTSSDRKRLAERFDAKWTIDPDSGCWMWTAYIKPTGYGSIVVGSRRHGDNGPRQAHRVSYELRRGPIPQGLTLDHLCRNRACVNPDHLEPVTMRENTIRGEAGKLEAERRLALTHCPHGHPYSGSNLFVRSNGHRGCRACRIDAEKRWRARRVADHKMSPEKADHEIACMKAIVRDYELIDERERLI